jgi:two-component system, NtrC family, sensor kinase
MLNYLALTSLINGITSTTLGYFVYTRGRKDIRCLTYVLLCLSVSIWSYFYFLWQTTQTTYLALYWVRGLMAGAIFIPVNYLHYILASVNEYKKNKKILILGYTVAFTFFVFNFTPYFVKGVAPSSLVHFSPVPGNLFHFYILMFISYAAYGVFILWKSYRQSTGATRNQLLYVFLATIIGYTGGLTNFPLWYNMSFYPSGNILVSVSVAIFAYAIIKHRLMDITVVIHKGLAYGLFLGLIFVPTYFVILALIHTFTGSMQYLLTGILVGAFSVLAGVVSNLHLIMEKAIGKALFKNRYNAYDTIKNFSNALVRILDLKDLNEKIIMTLSGVMGIEKVSMFLFDSEKCSYLLSTTHGNNEESLRRIKIEENDLLPRYLKKSGQLIIKEEMEHSMSNAPFKDGKEILDMLSRIESEICIPLMNKEQLIGFLNLGHKTALEMYTPEDLNLLSTLAQNAAIALDNALLYEDLKRQKSLMRRTDRLRSLETIAGGFAHEIRNPLTSIKTFIQLAPERREDDEFVVSFSKVVSEDVHRIERLIQEILDYARYMQPRLSEEDLNDVVESSLYFVRVKADGKDIAVEKELAGDLPSVLIDRQQIKQVLLNLYLNALDAMPDGGGLFVKTHSLSKGNENKWVQIEVRDTGSGISGENLDHIFDPFFTTKHESEEREGTGLGLTIIHQIVQEHRGYIEVESQSGVGTTFFVNLPANPMVHERRKEHEAVT